MKPSDLKWYEAYKELVGESVGIRLIFAYPDDYIALLRENESLRAANAAARESERRYGVELYRAIAAEDKLKYLHQWLNDHKIFVPNFKW